MVVEFLGKKISEETLQFVIAAKMINTTIEDIPHATRERIQPFLPTKINAVKRLRAETDFGLRDAISAVNLVWATIDCVKTQ